MSNAEALGVLLLALIVLAGAAIGISDAQSKARLAQIEQDLISTRLKVQQLFSGSSDYNGLDNATAIKAGIVPKGMIKGSSLKHPWGGDITLSSNSSNGSFVVQLAGVPQEECTQLAKFQFDAWLSVEVNGNGMSSTNTVTDIVASCGSSNSIAFEAR